MRRSIKEPIPEIYAAYDALSSAVDAHLKGDHLLAERHFLAADSRTVWNWTNPGWSRPDLNVVIKRPDGDTRIIPKERRDPDRKISRAVRIEVLKRDGFRCRYCGIPVVDAEIRKIARALYPKAVPWINNDAINEHAGFQCLWLQYDHVLPHCHGGLSSHENVVISCALCNFGKDQFTLRQLGLVDPRDFPPEKIQWDGLERMRTLAVPSQTKVKFVRRENTKACLSINVADIDINGPRAFFLAGARVNAGYLYTPPIDGKERWFALGPTITAEPKVHLGISGYQLVCDPKLLLRRGIKLEALIKT